MEKLGIHDEKHSIQPLIPHHMKWEDYDSVRYQGNIVGGARREDGNIISGSGMTPLLGDIS